MTGIKMALVWRTKEHDLAYHGSLIPPLAQLFCRLSGRR